ncbi:hypothetical protein TTHERM_00497100 (macronuclear) [Tetrahymena thermophila SB210]|uniref:P-loop containing nucleoside triphosphate hydrolase n=1 Tax=Tetrahymena thermophila (strain SB210) TaxID=312017 RepID=I7LY41_TETTS|nr:hypothetical protein TTHERM_00497100 [Tetrahymena thermophila SB210]EAS07657.2 hypothetical protein TTHERM_00497100 [Tetrahymena thermophila SB210]|eukprot:XP_001027899.2 hypothetical protein TTHERM_00497100 [Tetrahymena thermophila SB210]
MGCPSSKPYSNTPQGQVQKKNKADQLYIQIVGLKNPGKQYLQSLISQPDKSFIDSSGSSQSEFRNKTYSQCFNRKINFQEYEQIELVRLEQNKESKTYVVFVIDNGDVDCMKHLQEQIEQAKANDIKFKIIVMNCKDQNDLNQTKMQELEQTDLTLYYDNYEEDKQKIKKFFTEIDGGEQYEEDNQSRTDINIQNQKNKQQANKQKMK